MWLPTSPRAGQHSLPPSSPFPLAPATAEVLALALLTHNISARAAMLSDALTRDEALAGWSRSVLGDQLPVDALACGLAPRLEELLDWDDRAAQGSRAEERDPGGDATSDSPIARLLPALARRLRRLKQLETRFAETLEAEKLEAMAEFAAGAGHEINNPLAVISGRAQLFLRHETDPERRRELAVMNSQARRVYEMIADMMLFARPPKPQPAACDVAALVDRIAADLSPRAQRQGVAIVHRESAGPLVVSADESQLIVALRAVCDNALAALSEGGRIEISAQSAGGGVEITVRDDGPGIPPDARRHLFDPFYSGRASGRGLGLGLSKCWRIVTNHGGSIEVGDTGGRGAAFTIRLPRGCQEPLAAGP